jgi:hypothetical protein
MIPKPIADSDLLMPCFHETLTIWGFLCENTKHGFSPIFFLLDVNATLVFLDWFKGNL